MDYKLLSELVIDRARRVHKFTPDGKRVWTANQPRDFQLSVGGETVYATDAQGTNIMGFDRSKTANFSFSNALFHLGILADQLGTEKQVATAEKKQKMTVVELAPVNEDGETVTLAHTPVAEVEGVPFKYIDVVDANYNTIATYELGTTAATEFSVNGATITLPTGANLTAKDHIAVKYTYEASEGIVIINDSEKHSETGVYIVETFCYNPCDRSNKLLVNVIFPNGKQGNEVEVTLNNEATHPVNVEAMPEYCALDKTLFRIEVVQ